MDFFWLQICCVGLNRLQMSHLCFGYLVRTHETVYYEYGGRKSAMLQRFQPLDTLHVHPFISSMWKLMHRVCCTLCLWVTAPLFLHPFVVSYMSQNASQFSQDFTFSRRWVLSFYHQTYSGKLRLHARKKTKTISCSCIAFWSVEAFYDFCDDSVKTSTFRNKPTPDTMKANPLNLNTKKTLKV